MMAGLSRDVGSGGMFRRGTGLWLLVLTLALGLRDRMVPCKECADTDGARTVDDADAKCGRLWRKRHLYYRQKNTADGADGKPCPTAPLPADEEESGNV